jgi:hypothetical protein
MALGRYRPYRTVPRAVLQVLYRNVSPFNGDGPPPPAETFIGYLDIAEVRAQPNLVALTAGPTGTLVAQAEPRVAQLTARISVAELIAGTATLISEGG